MKQWIFQSIRGIVDILLGHKTTTRSRFLRLIPPSKKTLEVGPFTNPGLRGANVAYFDVLNREDLIKRANSIHYAIADPNDIPEIDYVSPVADLSIVSDCFDQVYSSHYIEHQPNLIKPLQDVSRLINPGGLII